MSGWPCTLLIRPVCAKSTARQVRQREYAGHSLGSGQNLGLDAYLLWQERLFRALYDRVRLIDEAEIDFSMDVGVVRADPRLTWVRALGSRTLVPFYGALAAVVIIVAVVV